MKLKHFSKNDRQYLVVPSVYFVALIDITNPNLLVIKSIFPISQFAFGIDVYQSGNSFYCNLIQYEELKKI